MRKFIHSDFEIDLSPLSITDTAENPWFNGSYFAKYSYPFTLPLTPDNDRAFGYISHYNSSGTETLFEGIYIHGNTMEKAILELEELQKEMSLTIRYGLDDFPNFDKKLSELPLQILQVQNIYEHAATVIVSSWPGVNYNFPQVHIDKIETEDSETWEAFEKIINNYKDGAFLINEVNVDEEITYNRNIIQPLPYLLYLLTAGINAAGFTLHGDVLEDSTLQRTLVYADVEYYRSAVQDSIEVMVPATEYESIYPVEMGYSAINLAKNVIIPVPGRYRITGQFNMDYFNTEPLVFALIIYREQVLYTRSFLTFRAPGTEVFEVELEFDTVLDGDPDVLKFITNTRYDEEAIVIDLSVSPVFLYSQTGGAVPSIQNTNEVNLTKAVPDMLFGDLVKVVLAAKNMDMTLRGTEVWINFVQKEIVTREIVDLSDFEIKFPKSKFSKGNSFLLKYQDVDSEEYKFAQVFQNNDIVSTSEIKKDDKTTEISINALPLPLLVRSGVQTAHAFAQDKAKPFFVVYDGLIGYLNLSRDPSALLIPYLHENHHKAWLAAIINSRAFSWSFTANYMELLQLTSKSRVHAYNNIHMVKSLQKTEVKPDLFDVEIETVVFK
jgi:hypothetical protein